MRHWGPATSTVDAIERLIAEGVDIFRMNFSHGTFDNHGALLDAIRTAQNRAGRVTAIMGDLCGPKIRTSPIESGPEIQPGQRVTILRGDTPGTTQRFGSNYEALVDELAVGHRVFIDDGQIQLHVVESRPDEIICEVIHGGLIKSRKGINLPDTNLSTSSITERDWSFVDWAIEHQLDFLALSFVRSADDVRRLKTYLAGKQASIQVVAKIETPQAIADLENIVRESDAILVARGDLGVEMDLAEVPILQKRMTHLCRSLNKPVIVATQMLQSMIESPMATRAEVSDVANAIMDYTDAIMLSGETAVGQFPVEAVRTMGRIARITESWMDAEPYIAPPRLEVRSQLEVAESFIIAAGRIVEQARAGLLAIWDEEGTRAPLISKARIDTPALAFCSEPRIAARLAMSYGIVPLIASRPDSIQSFIEIIEATALANQWAHRGDRIVIIASHAPDLIGNSEGIFLHHID